MFGRITMIVMGIGLGIGLWVTSDPVEGAWWKRPIMPRHPSEEWGDAITNGYIPLNSGVEPRRPS